MSSLNNFIMFDLDINDQNIVFEDYSYTWLTTIRKKFTKLSYCSPAALSVNRKTSGTMAD